MTSAGTICLDSTLTRSPTTTSDQSTVLKDCDWRSNTCVVDEFAFLSALCLAVSSRILNRPATNSTTTSGMRTVGYPFVLLIGTMHCIPAMVKK